MALSKLATGYYADISLIQDVQLREGILYYMYPQDNCMYRSINPADGSDAIAAIEALLAALDA